jgi:hypothetical protein
MTRREEILLNITLMVAALSLLIFILLGPVPEDMTVPYTRPVPTDGATVASTTETPYNAGADRYPAVGDVPIFRALLTPTPTPLPPTPRPTPTPDINAGLGKFRVQGIMDGVIILEDPEKSRNGAPDAILEWKVGEVRQLDSGRGETRAVKLEKVDETTDPSNPTATFSMEGTTEKKVLKMFEQ